jgi:two-component system response regulator FlrC
MIGNSLPMWRVKNYLLKVAMTDSHVLITGETGFGKELAARFIHDQSNRPGKPFVAINCAAPPDGLLKRELFGYERGAFAGTVAASSRNLKLGDGSTVLFDEISDMSAYAQAKTLRMNKTKEVFPMGGQPSVPLYVRII